MKAIKIILFVATLFTTTVYADPVTVPNTFTAGTPAKASEVNANFNALANAINANAGLMVYDSNGKKIGQYMNAGSGGYVIVSSLGQPFLMGITAEGWNNIYPESFYYTSSNCTGTAYLYGGNYDGLVLGGVVPQGSSVASIGGVYVGFLSGINSEFHDGSCSANTSAGVYFPLVKVNRTVDLSGWTPPFSVH